MLGYWFPRAARRKPSSLNPKTNLAKELCSSEEQRMRFKINSQICPYKTEVCPLWQRFRGTPHVFMPLKESIRFCKEAPPSVSLPLSCPDVFLLPSVIYSSTVSGSLQRKCYSSPRRLTFQAPNKIKTRETNECRKVLLWAHIGSH